jgi:tol-pal system protein YbgF
MSFFKPAPAVALAVGSLVACAHRGTDGAAVEQLTHQVETLRVQNAAYAKQVEELENRVFILSDQLESRKVNEQRAAPPQLPTITLHPEPARAIEPEPEVFPDLASTVASSDPEIEYAGEAAKTGTRRPLLKLQGEQAPVFSEPTIESARASAREATRGTVVREPPPARPKVAPDANAFQLYRKGYEALRAGQNESARDSFTEFLRLFVSHDLADNAQYWLGECSYDRKDYTSAVREFRRVVERYPHGNKVPDALLKVGYSYLALGSVDAGKQTLEQLIRSYPRHEAANLATARLAELDRPKPVRASNDVPATGKDTHSPEEAP